MRAKSGFYSIIRHVPLPSSNNSEIVGVVLLCSDPDYIGVAFALQGLRILGDMLERMGEGSSPEHKTTLSNPECSQQPMVFRSLTQLKEYLSDLGSEFQLSTARRISISDPAADIESILRRAIPT